MKMNKINFGAKEKHSVANEKRKNSDFDVKSPKMQKPKYPSKINLMGILFNCLYVLQRVFKFCKYYIILCVNGSV